MYFVKVLPGTWFFVLRLESPPEFSKNFNEKYSLSKNLHGFSEMRFLSLIEVKGFFSKILRGGNTIEIQSLRSHWREGLPLKLKLRGPTEMKWIGKNKNLRGHRSQKSTLKKGFHRSLEWIGKIKNFGVIKAKNVR